MDRQKEQAIDRTMEEIKKTIKDLEPGTMLTLEMPDMANEDDHSQKEEGE